MSDLASAIVMAMRQPKQLTVLQQNVELQFRLIRNGLGNHGGHGDDAGDRALIRMEQQSTYKGVVSILRFRDPLPSGAHLAVTYTDGAKNGTRYPLDADRNQISVGPHDITRVEILDVFGVRIAAGIPVRLASVEQTAAETATSANQ